MKFTLKLKETVPAKIMPELGGKRTITKFLILPVKIGLEIVIWERATIEQQYCLVPSFASPKFVEKWRNLKFIKNMEPDVKNCLNCAHEKGNRCLASGWFCATQRKYPSKACNIQFSGWQQRPKQASILKRIWNLIFAWD